MNELLSFRKMITPVIIQIVFWIGVGMYALAGLGVMIASTYTNGFVGFLFGVIAGTLLFAFGSLMVRIWCELIILLFKIYDELKAIRSGTAPPSEGFPVTPSTGYAPPGYPPVA